MPTRKADQDEGAAQAFEDQLRRAGVDDPAAFKLELSVNLEIHKAELRERIPELSAATIMQYTAAVAAAIAAEAITPDVGRALLYAAQLAIGARAANGDPTMGTPAQPRPRAARA